MRAFSFLATAFYLSNRGPLKTTVGRGRINWSSGAPAFRRSQRTSWD